MACIALVFACLAWSLVYEIVVALRWRPAMVSEGASRWSLLQVQNADRSFDGLLVAWRHFYARVGYPGTQAETILRALIAAGVVAAGGVGLVVVGFVTRKPTPFGDAKLGSIIDAERSRLTNDRGLVLGVLNGKTLTNDDPSHVLVVGPTRSGKGISFLIPNGYAWRGSSVWFDPKQENFEVLGAYRQRLGDKVFIFAPGQAASNRFNFIDFIRRDDRAPTDCAVIAEFMVPLTGTEIWGPAARQYLAVMIGYVVFSKRYGAKRNLRAVSLMTSTGEDFKNVLTKIVKEEGDELPLWVVRGFNQITGIEPETRNSVLFNLNVTLNPWNSDLIAAVTAVSDFDIRKLRRERMSIFIGCSVAQLSVYRGIVSVLIQQIHDVLSDRLPGEDEPYKVLIVVDEFRQLGRMNELVSKLPISAAYGFRTVLILQDVAQLDEVYGKPVRITTLSACQLKIFISITDIETAKWVSESMGSRTVEIHTPVIRAGQGMFSRGDKNVHYQERPLRSPQELQLMSERTMVVMVPNAPPFELRKVIHFKHQPYKKVYEANGGRKPHKLIAPALPKWVEPRVGAVAAAARSAPKATAGAKTPSVPPSEAAMQVAPKAPRSNGGGTGAPLDRAQAAAPPSGPEIRPPVVAAVAATDGAPKKIDAVRAAARARMAPGAPRAPGSLRVEDLCAGAAELMKEGIGELGSAAGALLAPGPDRDRLLAVALEPESFGETGAEESA